MLASPRINMEGQDRLGRAVRVRALIAFSRRDTRERGQTKGGADSNRGRDRGDSTRRRSMI